MTTQIRPRDWEALSAYLDNQLNPGDRKVLESRLIGDPELQSASRELQRTRLVLRQAPKLRAPEAFP